MCEYVNKCLASMLMLARRLVDSEDRRGNVIRTDQARLNSPG